MLRIARQRPPQADVFLHHLHGRPFFNVHGRDFRVIQIGELHDVARRKDQVPHPHILDKLIRSGPGHGSFDGHGFLVSMLLNGMNDDFIFMLQRQVVRGHSGHRVLQIKMDKRIFIPVIDADNFRLVQIGIGGQAARIQDSVAHLHVIHQIHLATAFKILQNGIHAAGQIGFPLALQLVAHFQNFSGRHSVADFNFTRNFFEPE